MKHVLPYIVALHLVDVLFRSLRWKYQREPHENRSQQLCHQTVFSILLQRDTMIMRIYGSANMYVSDTQFPFSLNMAQNSVYSDFY